MKHRHKNRMGRSKAKRMVKTATRGQRQLKRRGLGPEGLMCKICSPGPWSASARREREEQAALQAMREEVPWDVPLDTTSAPIHYEGGGDVPERRGL